jgi:hypothetical protein
MAGTAGRFPVALSLQAFPAWLERGSLGFTDNVTLYENYVTGGM